MSLIAGSAACRRPTARILERDGFAVLSASNGPAGVEIFQAHRERIDCVILDLTMPGMRGEQVAHAIHQIRPGVPIVVMSGYAAEETRVRFQGQHIAGFLHKPFHPADLRAALAGALKGADAAG